MKQLSTHEALRRIFGVIVREAEQNPALARKLGLVIAEGFAAESKTAKPALRKQFDRPEFHAIIILRSHGEAALRGKLEQVKTVENLKFVARASGLVLTGNACKVRPSRADLINGIIAAAKHYDAQRSAATT